MQLTIKECPVCTEKEFERSITAKDYLITKETFQIVKCTNCSFQFTNPRPFDFELGKYYQSLNYDSHNTKSSSLKDILYNTVRNISTARKLKYIKSIAAGTNLLDIGSGAGYFINYCHKNNWSVEGVEPNLQSFPDINAEIKIHSNYNTIGKEAFDIITMWHSLEHVGKLEEVLKTVSAALKDDGKLIIAVPNIASFDFNYYQEYWAGLDVPRHLYHFTQTSMKLLVERYGLKIIKTMPLIFDSYYVSLLSEKYKTGQLNYLTAFRMGWKSNKWAKVNNNDYSSLMYTITKK
ncbi:MAG TPA: class I SAM-dependent methyltransferase [Cytophagales bacterium]|nr:class I SAM-dependent methyltransferase [Cytophagales bacterium]